MTTLDETWRLQRALLDEALSKAIERNEAQAKTWSAYKKGHEKVAEALRVFPKSVKVNCMVPLGPKALMEGRLIHTNEILVCLGDGYFAKYSAHSALALCQRRIQFAEKMLKDLDTERDLYEMRQLVPLESDAFGDSEAEDITEHWEEERVEEWRVQHREREKEYHKKLSELRNAEPVRVETEEDLFHRLDQLELEEELADELNRLDDEERQVLGEEGSFYDSDETESEEEDVRAILEEELKKLRDIREARASVSKNAERPRDEELRTIPEDSEAEEKEQSSATEVRKKKSVSFVEPRGEKERGASELAKKETAEDEEEVVRIEFTHTSAKPRETEAPRANGVVESPADIHRLFSKPRSILKRSPNDTTLENTTNVPEYETDDEDDEEDEEDVVKPSAYEVVVKDIKERTTKAEAPMEISKPEEESRPVSKFRRERSLKK